MGNLEPKPPPTRVNPESASVGPSPQAISQGGRASATKKAVGHHDLPLGSLKAMFGSEADCATQLVFGAPRHTGRVCLKPGTCCAVLGTDRSHGGRRVRSWLTLFRVPGPTSPPLVPAHTRGVEGEVDVLGILMQPSKHRQPGPVATVLTHIETLQAQGVPIERAPSAYWRFVIAAASAGRRLRNPTLRQQQLWRKAKP